MPEHPTKPSRAGTVVGGRYQLLRRVGAGGSAVVYEAENTWTHRRVALKLLHEVGDESARRFLQEARVAASLRHPNVVDVLDMGEDESDGGLFIVQELIDGEDLAQRLSADGPLGLSEALEILVPVLGALMAAHARGVVHRDLKPANVLLARDGAGLTPKLIDFGVSKVLDAPTHARTRTGTLLGTPVYMSPEQLRAEGDVDARSDVWAVGVMLYEMLAGRRPFDAESHHAVMYKVLESTPERLERAAPTVPADVADVVHRALARDRTARFQSARDLLDALLACPSVQSTESGRSLARRHAASLSPAAVTSAPSEAESALPVATEPTPSTHRPHTRSGDAVSADPYAHTAPAAPAVPAPRAVSRRLVAAALAATLAIGVGFVALRTLSPPEPSRVPEIRSVIRSQIPHLRGCYDRERAAHPAIAGRALPGVLHLTVGPDGRAHAVNVTGLDAAPAMARCIEGHFADLQYPTRAQGANTTIHYPLTFRSE